MFKCGSIEFRELQARIKNLRQLETKKGYEFQRLKDRIHSMGRSDYEMRKAIVYRENYIKEMEKYKGFENYDKLMFTLKAIKNPIQFYNFLRDKDNDLLTDLTYQSDQTFTQKAFNRFLRDLGVNIDLDTADIIESLEDYL